MTAGYIEFEFDLPEALLNRLVEQFDKMERAPLDSEHVSQIPEAQGVYQLFLDGNLVYIGKTDAEAGLLRRLSRHSRKTLHRVGLAPERVSFKAVRIFVFTAIDLESQLIRHYAPDKGTAWNGSGFGANDPGRERDSSKPGKYDTAFPIDLDRPLDVDFSNVRLASDVITSIKAAIPYTLRVQSASKGSRKPHADLIATAVTMPRSIYTVRTVLAELTTQLPAGWQATALSALLILYKENSDNYPNGIILGRS